MAAAIPDAIALIRGSIGMEEVVEGAAVMEAF
jgi:hypothetical protein